MFEQDYIMRIIKDVIRMVLKLVFHIDTESPTEELVMDAESKYALEQLMKQVDDGQINEAENKLFAMTEDMEKQSLEVALLFYSYLNDKDDDFLEEHDFSREEVKNGLEHIVSKYGLTGVIDLFLTDF